MTKVKGWAVLHDQTLHMSPRPDIFHELAKETAEHYAEVYREETGRKISVVPCEITFDA